MTILYVIRHGETHWNVERRMQGRGDSPLTPRGRAQAASHAEVLVRLGGVDALLVSPSGRTRETAAILENGLVAAGLGAPVSYHEALMERDSGAWEGLTIDEIEERFPEDWASRDEDPYFHRPPRGENHADMELRIAALLDDLMATVLSDSATEPRAPRRIALVTHGIMSRVILKCLLALEPAEAVSLRHPNALFYRLEIGPDRVRGDHFLDGSGPFPGLFHG